MLIEQAFFNLPEIMVGAGYGRQEYEAGIVSAFSLALLQELNGRNAANPISYLRVEKRFSDDVAKLRADIHVSLSDLYIGTRAFSEFGFRYSNWIEAKYFRKGRGTPPSTQNLGAVVADLVRLIALVPIERSSSKPDQTITGRYFLHAYRGNPLEHLCPRKKSGDNRRWVKKFLRAGRVRIDSFQLDEETDTFFTHLGMGFKHASLELTGTNFKIEPLRPTNGDFYTLVLTRIESAKITFGQSTYAFEPDRTFIEPEGGHATFQKSIAEALKKKESETNTVDEDEIEIEESATAGGAAPLSPINPPATPQAGLTEQMQSAPAVT